MAGESEALAAELKARKESRDCDLGKDAASFFEVSGTGGYQTKQFDTRSEAEAYVKKIMSLAVPPSGKDLPKILEKKYSSIKAQDAGDVSEKKRKLEQEIKEAEKQLETMLSPNGRKALAKDLYEMRSELRALG